MNEITMTKLSVALVVSMMMVGSAIAEKHIVFLAGPRQSDATEAYNFFDKHATGADDDANGNSTITGLKGWVWPQITEELPGEKHRYFENFFWSPGNATIQNILMQSIQDAWNAAEHGVILGADGFDNTRGDPSSIALQTMEKIITMLQVPDENVHVVMQYKSPRLDQWVSLYHHNAINDYQTFICGESYTEHLANIPMNPFMLASIYRDRGWNVATIDHVGTRHKRLDVSHSVACRVLPNTECENDWIAGLEGQTTGAGQVFLGEFMGLELPKENELEGMFLSRDCHYKEKLEADEGFTIVHRETVWEECGKSDFEKNRYQRLTDNEHFFDLVKAQMGCGESQGNAPMTTIPPVEYTSTDGDDDDFWDFQTIGALIASVVAALCLVYTLIAKMKRRQTHYVRSPKSGEDLWINFADDAFQVQQENLRSPSNEDEDEDDGAFADVDLNSPEYKNRVKDDASSFHSSQTGGSAGGDSMSAAAKSGRSVRGFYRVAVCEDSPSGKVKPQKGDSDIEIKIKTLESEFV